jgi:uncharacterized membrane protein YjgN (DUF898 family)
MSARPTKGEIMDRHSRRFYFDGGACSYLRTGILAALITVCTFGLGFPYALVLFERWRARHTYIDGQRLMFTGTGLGLFAMLVKCLLLMMFTFGVYSFWVVPRVQAWKVEHIEFDPTWAPKTLG